MPVGSGMDYQKKEKRGIMKRRLLFLLMLPLALGLWAQAGDYDQTYIIGRLAFQGDNNTRDECNKDNIIGK